MCYLPFSRPIYDYLKINCSFFSYLVYEAKNLVSSLGNDVSSKFESFIGLSYKIIAKPDLILLIHAHKILSIMIIIILKQNSLMSMISWEDYRKHYYKQFELHRKEICRNRNESTSIKGMYNVLLGFIKKFLLLFHLIKLIFPFWN